ncbi:ketoacyl-synt-domain-containing protein [Aspergillus aculeatinus CBS 121060]|uniref:Ketoacyl-synt-domain-containing protein n=1 Tax=Aspergillus aculeatinus CBS 121060 TaxID=1448322 RepID=A0ACD1GU88_9EURO|nr:ketoacyl-synt-domain-containing protein [Aspergillus aculeatinus CBS 121060]RAH64894.1 ketoacyl-synt-domain-containing protein [Aspergillus aculeatinus CBS 121060]
MSIFDYPLESIEEKLSSYNEQATQHERPEVRVTAIFHDSISVSGDGVTLEGFNGLLARESIQCRWANVHAMYHYGEEMDNVRRVIVHDVETRGITLPSWNDLHVPLRWASEPQLHSVSLVEAILQKIFLDAVDWRETEAHLESYFTRSLNRDSEARYRVLGIGPGSKSLIHVSNNLLAHPRLEVRQSWVSSLTEPSMDDIAVVGTSVNYPGAKGLEEFWELLESGRSTMGQIPSDRFDLSSRQGVPSFGNFIKNPFEFDAPHFNISPREAKSMDPQQRLLLHAAVEALDDAGYAPGSSPSYQKETFGVYVGVATGDYVDNLRTQLDIYYSPGTLRAFLSGRISYAFKMNGPSIVIDTACSSSLVALHHACMALQRGECRAALAGGVNIISSPDMYCGLARAHFLSLSGQCKPFDEAADGYCRAEGCGMVVLKKLADAMEEDDHIYGVIRGIGINQCGTAKSITHPDAATQAALFRDVLRSSRLTPADIDLVEAHGTGTQAGDYAEASSLRAVFGSRPSTSPRYLCSLKGNIGHAEAASGVAGLAKLLLMLEKHKVPPQASFNKINPRLQPLLEDAWIIPTKLTDWTKRSGPRRALLNNFGAAGSNCALIVEEFMQPTTFTQQTRSHHVCNLSARTAEALEAIQSSYLECLLKQPDLRLEDFCYTVNARRQQQSAYRASIIVQNRQELARELEQPLVAMSDLGKHREPGKTVFVYSGQGAVYAGMGLELLATVPTFRDATSRCDAILTESGFFPVTPFLMGTQPASGEEAVIISQCACFVYEYALARMFQAWCVKPDLVVGHSIGEYAASVEAGQLGLSTALSLLAHRARLMARKCALGSTGMVACRLPPATLEQLVLNRPTDLEGLTICCYNSPDDSVVAGPIGSLSRLTTYCREQGIRHKMLEVPLGFHSSAVEQILDDFSLLVSEVVTRPPSIQMGSSLYGRVLQPGERLKPGYFVDHARHPVRFSALISDIQKWAGNERLTVVEIGPSPSTEPMFKVVLAPRNGSYTFVASQHPRHPSWATLTGALRTLFLHDYPVNWRAVYDGSSARFVRSLPHTPLRSKQYLLPFIERPSLSVASAGQEAEGSSRPCYAFISPSRGKEIAGFSEQVFETYAKQIEPFAAAHSVGGVPLCPASVYMEVVLQALASTRDSCSDTTAYLLKDMKFDKPLVCASSGNEANPVVICTELEAARPPQQLQLFSCRSPTKTVFCTGSIRSLGSQQAQETEDILVQKLARVERMRRAISGASTSPTESFSSRTFYELIFPRVVRYTAPFLTIQDFNISHADRDGYGTFRLPAVSSAPTALFISPPELVDTLLHAAGFVANAAVDSDVACICVSAQEGMICHNSIHLRGQPLQVYCTVVDVGYAFLADSYALDETNRVIAYVEGIRFQKIKLSSFQALLSRGLARSGTTRASLPRDLKTRSGLETDSLAPASSAASTVVCNILAQLCETAPDIPHSRTLAEMGIDSLLMMELAVVLQQRFRSMKGVEGLNLEQCRTVSDVVAQVSMLTDAEETVIGTPSSGGAQTPAQTPIQPSASLRDLFVEVCGLEPRDGEKEQPLSLLGVDSLLSIELAHEIRTRLGLTLPDDFHDGFSGLTSRRLGELCAVSPSHRPPPRGKDIPHIHREDPRLGKLLHDGVLSHEMPSSGSEIYLFHDGSGMCGMYGRLSGLTRHKVYGIASPSWPFADCERPMTLQALASLYIEHTGLATTSSDVILGGWSFGGVLAFEAARQLCRRKRPVKGVVMIDSPAPVAHQALPAPVIDYVLCPGGGRALLQSEQARQTQQEIQANFRAHADLLENYHPAGPVADEDGALRPLACVLISCREPLDTDRLCGVSYPWLSDPCFRRDSQQQWESLTGTPLTVLEIPCDHFSPFRPDCLNLKASVEG